MTNKASRLSQEQKKKQDSTHFPRSWRYSWGGEYAKLFWGHNLQLLCEIMHKHVNFHNCLPLPTKIMRIIAAILGDTELAAIN